MSEESNPTHARYGLILFAIYLALYVIFVLLNVFAISVMETEVFGLTLSVIYGLGLIVVALILALIYAWLCRESRSTSQKEQS